MKKSILFIISIVLLGLIMVTLCPNEDDHKSSIRLSINQAIDERLGDGSWSIKGAVTYIVKLGLKKAAQTFVDSFVEVENYGLLSIGRYTFDNQNKVISVGMFNHVFTLNKEDVLEEIEKQGF